MSNCNQVGCKEPAVFRFTWPGHVERTICAAHRAKAEAILEALGYEVQFIPLPVAEPTLPDVSLEEEGDHS